MVTVTDRSKIIEGVRAVVVHDRVTTEAGEPVEDTFDWYAQDREGNVWYLGEDTKAYEGKKVSTEGSWEHGVDGAKAGIAMPGEPWVGLSYYQEFYRGHAEDAGEVLDLDASAKGAVWLLREPAEDRGHHCLEPDLIEHKYYASGIGMVYDQTIRGGDDEVRLLAFTPGPCAGTAFRPTSSSAFPTGIPIGSARRAVCILVGRAGPGNPEPASGPYSSVGRASPW